MQTIDFKRFRQIAIMVDTVLMVDMAHIADLVAAGLHESPVRLRMLLQQRPTKTLRGPRGGMIMAAAGRDENITNKAVFPGTYRAVRSCM